MLDGLLKLNTQINSLVISGAFNTVESSGNPSFQRSTLEKPSSYPFIQTNLTSIETKDLNISVRMQDDTVRILIGDLIGNYSGSTIDEQLVNMYKGIASMFEVLFDNTRIEADEQDIEIHNVNMNVGEQGAVFDITITV